MRFIEDRFDGLESFKYSIAIENSFHPHYWTEKNADCFLLWTMPIYCEPPNITDDFPEESMIIIDPYDPQKGIETIKQAIQDNRWKKNLDAIHEARNRALNKYQIFPWICEKIEQYADSPHEKFFIPKSSKPVKKACERLAFRIKRKALSFYIPMQPAYKKAKSQS
ncbi:MAG: glycosyltransferase family 10 domain-containing protein [Opitutaceae bacterium]